MTGVGIDEQDFIIVELSVTPRSGRILVAIIDGNYTVKRLDRKNRMVRLHAENPDFPPITPNECQEIEIWGVVIAAVKPFIKQTSTENI